MAKYFPTLPNVCSNDINQCMLGAPSKKTTTLLSVNITSLRIRIKRRLSRGLCDNSHADEVLKGIDERGCFRAAPAKQCSAPLSELLAGASHDDLVKYPPNCPPDLLVYDDYALNPFYMPLDAFCEGHMLWASLANSFNWSHYMRMTSVRMAS